MRTQMLVAALAIAATTIVTLSAQAGPMFGRGMGMGHYRLTHGGGWHGMGMRPGIGLPTNQPSGVSRVNKIEALVIKQKVTDTKPRPNGAHVAISLGDGRAIERRATKIEALSIKQKATAHHAGRARYSTPAAWPKKW